MVYSSIYSIKESGLLTILVRRILLTAILTLHHDGHCPFDPSAWHPSRKPLFLMTSSSDVGLLSICIDSLVGLSGNSSVAMDKLSYSLKLSALRSR